jgi:hypothetical protein
MSAAEPAWLSTDDCHPGATVRSGAVPLVLWDAAELLMVDAAVDVVLSGDLLAIIDVTQPDPLVGWLIRWLLCFATTTSTMTMTTWLLLAMSSLTAGRWENRLIDLFSFIGPTLLLDDCR